MLAVECVRWWYSAGWKGLVERLRRQLTMLTDAFSISLILRSLFAPWRQTITYSDNSLIMNLRATLDNVISRFVGFGARVVLLIAWLTLTLVLIVGGTLAVVVWPFIPGVVIALFVKGLIP